MPWGLLPTTGVIACTENFPAAIAEPILQALVGGLRIRFVDVAGKSPDEIVHVNVVVEVPGVAGGHTPGARVFAVTAQVPVVAAVLM